jgi:hypothetical protein
VALSSRHATDRAGGEPESHCPSVSWPGEAGLRAATGVIRAMTQSAMINIAAAILFALVRQGLISRLLLRLLRPMGLTFRRIWIAHFVTYILSTAIGMAGLPFDGPPRLLFQIAFNLCSGLIWLLVDSIVLARRRTRLRAAMAKARSR